MSTDADYRRKKHGMKTFRENDANSNEVGPTSQIPGLSHCVQAGPEERTRGRRVGILESDSEYVKLAKQGGQKGLLWHEDTNVDGKAGSKYRPPDWFAPQSDSHNKESPTKPTSDLLTSEETKKSPTKGTFSPSSAPFGGDDKSAWERDADGVGSAADKKISGVSRDMEKMALSPEEVQQANKFKRTSYDKVPAPVNMSKLLSYGYMEDEKKSPNAEEADALSVTSDPACPDTEDENAGPGEVE